MKRAAEKIVSGLDQLSGVCERLKLEGRRIVLTTGAFDILHEGHLRYLEEARSFGDVLVVGINSDEFVRGLKGANRPIVKEKDRAFLVAGFGCVDYTVVFDDRLEIVEAVRPHMFVMFAQSHCKPHEGNRPWQQQIVKKNGGEVIVLDEPGKRRYSTTALIERIRECGL